MPIYVADEITGREPAALADADARPASAVGAAALDAREKTREEREPASGAEPRGS
jgi:hypothetical protein